ncbi:MAG: type II toxin-antitoxin system RelE/ParE family toxin [Gammaproteobacteria bacterium PRO9]|nr:type II toxin-antitoxin system RelE/ParE family toxin [Gammaproteobacteria bacterium PRO9]
MSRTIIVTRAAEADILDGYRAYEEKQPGLGVRYLDEIGATFGRITSNPFQYQKVESDIRRAVVRTFPYLAFYILDSGSVHVLAVIHGAQDPAYITGRIGA